MGLAQGVDSLIQLSRTLLPHLQSRQLVAPPTHDFEVIAMKGKLLTDELAGPVHALALEVSDG